ncbi:MAG TPA: maleylpyruvate isomerase family mycothiol-dependent enzyme, partial [Pseudonocardiaceae bacterium]|nr:maleylpyruvate isomerase family mycothiol-dependent enzyme [Pseudonocardiaceae bacterium]
MNGAIVVDTWQLIETERIKAADAFGELTAPDWAAPSLCDGRSNQDTLAHMVSTAELSTGGFLAGMARNGFNFNRMTANDIKRVGVDAPAKLISRLRAAAPGHNHPPGPVAAMLLEAVVHGEDIVYPLGRTIDHSPAGLLGAADFAKGAQPLVGCKKRIAGLALHATDFEWSTGSGPEVRGPLVALLLAMSGRKTALDSLTGDGVAILR